MGFYIFSKGINLAEVQKVWGSNDDVLLQKIMNTKSYNHYKSEIVKGVIPLEQALRQIIYAQRPYNTKDNHQYGYAIICICSALGTKLPFNQELKFGFETDLVNEYIDSDFGLDDFLIEDLLLFEQDGDFDIPLIEDYPLIGVLPYNRLLKIQEKLQNIDIDDDMVEDLFDNSDDEDDEHKACAYSHIKGFQTNVEFCITNQLDLISFCH